MLKSIYFLHLTDRVYKINSKCLAAISLCACLCVFVKINKGFLTKIARVKRLWSINQYAAAAACEGFGQVARLPGLPSTRLDTRCPRLALTVCVCCKFVWWWVPETDPQTTCSSRSTVQIQKPSCTRVFTFFIFWILFSVFSVFFFCLLPGQDHDEAVICCTRILVARVTVGIHNEHVCVCVAWSPIGIAWRPLLS